MTRKRNPVVKAKEAAKRISGFTIPFLGAGVSWDPPVNERDTAKKLLIFLQDRRALYQPYNLEMGPYVVRSILEIRQRLVGDLEEIDSTSELATSLKAMLAACRRFLDKTQAPSLRRYRMDEEFIVCLGELRALIGLQIARIVCIYDLELEGDLISILPPPEVEAAKDTARRK